MAQLDRGQPFVSKRSAQMDRRQMSPGRRRTDGPQNVIVLEQQKREVSAGPFRIVDENRMAFFDGYELTLSPKEYQLLRILVANVGKVISPQELALLIWPRRNNGGTEADKQYVYRLRKKVEAEPTKPKWIQNVKGFGYQLSVTA